MIKIFRASNGPNCMKNTRDIGHLVGTVFVLLALSLGRNVYAAPTLRIAVAPFAGAQELGEIDALSVSNALATRLSDSNIERLIGPGDFVAESVFEPRASEVRRWAYNSAVDAIIVGRVSSKRGPGREGPRVVETVVRSGHSGAELSRHEVVVAHGGELDRSLDRLTTAILLGLGHVEPSADDIQPGPAVPGAVTNVEGAERADGNAESSERGLDGMLSESVFRNDAPIEIKAEEAEIVNRNQGRKLIFQRNVWVRKDNVTLRSDRLEASYQKGESEPRELVAQGKVKIVQNDRHAKCDRAVYLREANRLTCTGRAELAQGCDIIRGESIEFDLAGDQARVEGAASVVIHSKEEDANIESSACAENRGQM
jgi:lipopolysaccharide transport protein LptA